MAKFQVGDEVWEKGQNDSVRGVIKEIHPGESGAVTRYVVTKLGVADRQLEEDKLELAPMVQKGHASERDTSPYVGSADVPGVKTMTGPPEPGGIGVVRNVTSNVTPAAAVPSPTAMKEQDAKTVVDQAKAGFPMSGHPTFVNETAPERTKEQMAKEKEVRDAELKKQAGGGGGTEGGTVVKDAKSAKSQNEPPENPEPSRGHTEPQPGPASVNVPRFDT